MIFGPRWIKLDESAYFTIHPGKNPPLQNGCWLKSVFFLKHQFHILHFPNSTGLFTKPTGRHYTKRRFSPDIALFPPLCRLTRRLRRRSWSFFRQRPIIVIWKHVVQGFLRNSQCTNGTEQHPSIHPGWMDEVGHGWTGQWTDCGHWLGAAGAGAMIWMSIICMQAL